MKPIITNNIKTKTKETFYLFQGIRWHKNRVGRKVEEKEKERLSF